MITLEDLAEARTAVASVIRPTPSELSHSLSDLFGRSVILKPEQRQRTGSFKIRGAYNRICRLPFGTSVIAASAGNHAQGVALAAHLQGLAATIFMPMNAALPKVAATRGYGADVRQVGEFVDDSIEAARRYAAETGGVYVPPFDDPHIIAGQGTVGLELVEETPDAEVVLVPAGGGGLLAGVATAIKCLRPSIRVIGVEAAGAPTISAALTAGKPVRLERMATMADGIALRACSELTLAHIMAYVDEVITVDEEEISGAMLLLIERAKAVVEPSGAVGLAALNSGRVPGSGPAVVVLSGGNIDPLLLAKLIDHAMSAAGRHLVLRIVLPDRPGGLAMLTAELAGLGLNVLDVEHHRFGRKLGLDQVEVMVTVETRDHDHANSVVEDLRRSGLEVETLALS